MIAQAIAINHPERVRSLVSIMSTTGAPDVGQPRPDIYPLLLRPAPTTREEAVEAGVLGARLIGSTGYPFDEVGTRTRSADPLVDVSGGKATASAVPGSTLHLIPGMGHDLPADLWGTITDDIAAHAHPYDDRLAVAGSAT
ncbi:MAG: hypothetical protein NVSMB16_13650 [Acidimicrobiales bacterium]